MVLIVLITTAMSGRFIKIKDSVWFPITTPITTSFFQVFIKTEDQLKYRNWGDISKSQCGEVPKCLLATIYGVQFDCKLPLSNRALGGKWGDV